MKTLTFTLVTVLLSGCSVMPEPLLTVQQLPNSRIKISSEAPLNSSTGSTSVMVAEAARRCTGGYTVLSSKRVANSVEMLVDCNTASAPKLITGYDDPTTNQKAAPRGNDTVRRAQKALNELGYDSGRADGFLGENTKKALELFQTESELEATGRLDTNTQKMLGIL